MVSEVQEFCLRWNNHHSTLVTVLDKLLERETFVDVILAAEGQFIKVHRVVLCACSQYFEDLLSQQTDKQSIIFLKDVTFIDLKAIVDYMYRGEVNVSQDQLSSFLHTTEALKIKGLADKEKRGPPTQPSNSIASKVKRAAEQQQAPSPPPAPLPVIASTSTVEEIEEMPEEQEIEEETTTPVPTSVIDVSRTLHMDTDDHFIAINPKVESVDVDLSAEQLEGGDNSLWQNKEGEEDWSNSEGLSVSSAADQSNAMYNQSLDQEAWPGDASGAGPSTAKPNDGQGATSRGMYGDFPCEKCGLVFKHKNGLKKHKLTCGVDESYLTCPHCPYKCRRTVQLQAHIRCHTESGDVHKCQICFYMSKNVTTYRMHIMRHHPALSIYMDKVFGDKRK